jgi:hypothetical protein
MLRMYDGYLDDKSICDIDVWVGHVLSQDAKWTLQQLRKMIICAEINANLINVNITSETAEHSVS